MEETTRESIRRLRSAVREHRDQKGDDRCYLDDAAFWTVLDDAATRVALPSFGEGMRRCREFYAHRRAETADPIPPDAILDPARWDEDLAAMSGSDLTRTYAALAAAIRGHREVTGRPRALEDDRRLYAVLPERLPADFRLPPIEEFLGEAKSPCAGCPSFWRSHLGCGTDDHDLHRWGPCSP